MRIINTICLLSVVLMAGNAYAGATDQPGKVFIGAEYNHHDIDMKTEFIRRINDVSTERSFFDDNYKTGSGGIYVGYTMPYKHAYLKGRILFHTYKDQFELSAGSSRFTYKLNHLLGAEIIPGVYLFQDFSVYLRLGVNRGDFDFTKSSPTSTNYDVNTDLNGYILGLGLSYDISPRYQVNAGFNKTQFEETRIVASRDVLKDTTLVEPEGNTFFISFQYQF